MEKRSETDVASAVVAWLEDRGLDVFQEVRIEYGGRIADIVVKMGKAIWVIECKTGLTLAVLEQAHHWQGLAHMRSVAVPEPSTPKRRYTKKNARAMHPDWVQSIRDQCVAAGVKFFFKQWGGAVKKKGDRILDGRTWEEMP